MPTFKKRPKQPKISYKNTVHYQFLVYDPEQGGSTLSTGSSKAGETYNEYVLPTCYISRYASWGQNIVCQNSKWPENYTQFNSIRFI